MNPRKPIDMSDEPSEDELDQFDLSDDEYTELDLNLERALEEEGIYESLEHEIDVETELADLDKEFNDELTFDED